MSVYDPQALPHDFILKISKIFQSCFEGHDRNQRVQTFLTFIPAL